MTEGAETYTVTDVSLLTGLSRKYVTRLFEREPGVIILQARKERTIRIPRRVYERVMRRHTVQ